MRWGLSRVAVQVTHQVTVPRQRPWRCRRVICICIYSPRVVVGTSSSAITIARACTSACSHTSTIASTGVLKLQHVQRIGQAVFRSRCSRHWAKRPFSVWREQRRLDPANR